MKMQMQSDSTAKLVAALTLSAVVMAYTVGGLKAYRALIRDKSV